MFVKKNTPPNVDDSHAISTYANNVNVKMNPEEVILDFSLIHFQENMTPLPCKPFKRVAVNYYTAKRLVEAIQQTLERHEGNFGVVKITAQANSTNQPVEEDAIIPIYANLCGVVGTPEEMLIDFLTNPNPFGKNQPVLILSDRVVLNYTTAKVFLHRLKTVIDHYEKYKGKIEIDVNKRLRK